MLARFRADPATSATRDAVEEQEGDGGGASVPADLGGVGDVGRGYSHAPR